MGGLAKKLLATAVEQSLEPIAGAVDFDGANDCLLTGADLIGNSESSTLTFSAFVWLDSAFTGSIYDSRFNQFRVSIEAGGSITIRGQNSGGAVVLAGTSEVGSVPQRTWAHVLISIDLTSTAKRSIYVNGVLKSATWATYSLGGKIWFPANGHSVGRERQLVINYLKGRLAHVFLDYTYRDLSIEANRRLFITADRKPAENQAALNPILYLPLTDPTQPGKNLGTGGDFALTGVVARSGRGPNQFNTPASQFNAYRSLSRGVPKVVATEITGCFSVSYDPLAANNSRFILGNGTALTAGWTHFSIRATKSAVSVEAYVGSDRCFSFSIPANLSGRLANIVFSVNRATSTAIALVNGVVSIGPVTWGFATKFELIATSPIYIGADSSPAGGGPHDFSGTVGNFFLDTRYIDLSQPANLAKFVTGTGIDAKPVDLGANGEKPFGTPPLIYLPMYGNNAGKNYGTGGDFTVNSGPFPGARGPSEYWGNKADFNGTTGYLARTSALNGVASGKTFSFSFFVTFDVLDRYIFAIRNGTTKCLLIYITGGTDLAIEAMDATGNTVIANTGTVAGFAAGVQYHVCGAFDTASSTLRRLYINNVAASNGWTTSPAGQDIRFGGDRPTVGAQWAGSYSDFLDGKLSELYFTTDYIDFSQEANRLKFRDAFGNPVALLPQIEAGEIPNPAIYMRFDPANFGKNLGTGGDFTVNGTITDGGQL